MRGDVGRPVRGPEPMRSCSSTCGSSIGRPRRAMGPSRCGTPCSQRALRVGAIAWRDCGARMASKRDGRDGSAWWSNSISLLPPAPNRLHQVFVAPAVNRIWVGDLTAIATRSGWLYLAVLLDLYSRRVIGWAMSAKPDQHLALEALRMALVSRRPHQGLLHHTDQGATYTSVAYQQRLAEHGIAASMSRKGNCYDNAVAESFFSTLKNELVHERDYHTREEARAEIFEFIEVFYNRQRLHQTLGYVSPEQFETQNPVPLRGCLRNRG